MSVNKIQREMSISTSIIWRRCRFMFKSQVYASSPCASLSMFYKYFRHFNAFLLYTLRLNHQKKLCLLNTTKHFCFNWYSLANMYHSYHETKHIPDFQEVVQLFLAFHGENVLLFSVPNYMQTHFSFFHVFFIDLNW